MAALYSIIHEVSWRWIAIAAFLLGFAIGLTATMATAHASMQVTPSAQAVTAQQPAGE